MREQARLYLDVDGVINAVTHGTPEAGWDTYERAKVAGWSITYSPEFVAVLNQLAQTPGLGIYWLTTWCSEAPQKLAPRLGIAGSEWPVVGAEHQRNSGSSSWWKLIAIQEHLEDFAGTVLWVDDDHGYDAAAEAWLLGQPNVLAMSPRTRVGVTRAEANVIQRFAADCVVTSAADS